MKINFKKKYTEVEDIFVADWIATQVELSKIKIKKSIEIGGLWITKSGQRKKERIKKIKTKIQKDSIVELNYDSSMEFADESLAIEVFQGGEFGVWYKPAGMLSDGSPYADRGSLSYLIKSKSKKCFLIQRLDREVSGLMLVAYSKKMAGFFSKELQGNKISKYYQAQVLGIIKENGVIDKVLDGKTAETNYKLFKSKEGTSFCEVEITTGRFHQIRRHFDSIDHPLIGDPRYGEGNKNKDGLKLIAHKCEFFHPKKRERMTVELAIDKKLF
jgi:tRNA pseudouridine32 synthase/23S rRNA pseudouridine746 synthase